MKLLRRESQDYFNKEEQEAAALSAAVATNGVNKVSPTPVLNGKVNGSSMFNGAGAGPQVNGFASVSPVPQKEISAATAAALKASTPLRNNTSSDLVRQRIKSFDNGASASMPNGGGKVNGNTGGNAEKESLSVSKRRQLFESGGVSNMTSTVVRRDPSKEIKEAQQAQVKPKGDNNVPTTQSSNKTSVNNNSSSQVEEKITVVGCSTQRSPSPQAPPATIIEPVSLPPSVTPPAKPAHRPTESPARSPVPPIPSPARASPAPPSPQPHILGTPAPPPGFEDRVEGQPESLEQTETITIEITPEMGLCARALYDYQAGMSKLKEIQPR